MTLIDEVAQILSNTKDDGKGMNDLADKFRNGRKASDILLLIDSKDEVLISQGLWLLNELPADYYDKPTFVTRLQRLIDHKSPVVRWHSFGALFSLFDYESLSATKLIENMLSDENEGVRMSAEAALKQINNRKRN